MCRREHYLVDNFQRSLRSFRVFLLLIHFIIEYSPLTLLFSLLEAVNVFRCKLPHIIQVVHRVHLYRDQLGFGLFHVPGELVGFVEAARAWHQWTPVDAQFALLVVGDGPVDCQVLGGHFCGGHDVTHVDAIFLSGEPEHLH